MSFLHVRSEAFHFSGICFSPTRFTTMTDVLYGLSIVSNSFHVIDTLDVILRYFRINFAFDHTNRRKFEHF